MLTFPYIVHVLLYFIFRPFAPDRPMYSNESDSYSDNVVANHERELFEDLIVKYKVNIMFSGHYHRWAISCILL